MTGFSSSAGTTTFSYDSNGNRLSSTSVVGTLTSNRAYNVTASTNRLSGYTQTTNASGTTVTSTVSYTHDANGALTEDGIQSFHYDVTGRLTSANTGVTSTAPVTRYGYNPLGERVFKTEPVFPNATDTTNLPAFYARGWDPTNVVDERPGYKFTYMDDGTLLGEFRVDGTAHQQFVWLPTPNGPMPIVAIVSGNKYAIVTDHLLTPRRMYNPSGQAAWQWGYSAFGDEPATTARFRFGNLESNPNPGTTSVADVTMNLRYPGQYYDKETKFHYNYFRSYKPDNGRYTQPDQSGWMGGGIGLGTLRVRP